jgi:transmembrane sensor
MIKERPVVISRRRRRRQREASEWFVEHQSVEQDLPARLPEWSQWCRDARNRSEYAAVVRLRQQAGMLPSPSTPTDEELLRDSIEIQALSGGRVTRSLSRLCERASSLLPRSRLTIAALSAATFICTVALIFFRTGSLAAGVAQSYTTRQGEQRAFTLSDGSKVTLGGDTRLRVSFTHDARNLVLEQGEAKFKVHHDPRLPFIVHADGGSITAIGTEFVVRRYSRYSNRVRVWVTEGTVEVAPIHEVAVDELIPTPTALVAPVRVVHGQEVTYNANGDASAVKSSDTQAAAVLMQGSFVYRGRPLGEVIEDVQRYTARRISIDPDAAEIKFSGLVHQQEIYQWVRGLPEVYPGLIVEDRADTIVIRLQPAPRQFESQSALR